MYSTWLAYSFFNKALIFTNRHTAINVLNSSPIIYEMHCHFAVNLARGKRLCKRESADASVMFPFCCHKIKGFLCLWDLKRFLCYVGGKEQYIYKYHIRYIRTNQISFVLALLHHQGAVQRHVEAMRYIFRRTPFISVF